MGDSLVSVRMPETLFRELKDMAVSHHYLDISEEIRSILRQKWYSSANPQLYELKQLRDEIQEVVREKSRRAVQENVNEELKKIRQQLKSGGFVP
ncbi:MAG: hypothetical protein ABH879_10980 [archaeon]